MQETIAARDGESDQELQTMERAENLAKQYEDIKDRTVDDSTVLGKLTDIHTSEANGNISIEVDLPGEDADKTFRFSKPKVWSEQYKFVRWIRHYGYDADSFPSMLRDHCKVKVEKEDNGKYDLFIPDQEQGVVEKSKELAPSGFFERAKGRGGQVKDSVLGHIAPTMGVLWFVHWVLIAGGIITYEITKTEALAWTIVTLTAVVVVLIIENTIVNE